MTTSEQNPEENKPTSPEDRLEEIKKEEQEDASSYYAQGGSEEKGLTEEDFKKPLPPVDEDEEEMSLLKAVAFLGFGMAALAIIFILFFIRDLGNKVGDVDAAVSTLETRFGPLKQTVETGFARVDKDVGDLKNKFGSYEKMMAVMELKRAKVAIQEVTSNSSDPALQAKSGQLIASIDGMLLDLGAGEAGSAPAVMAPMAEPAPVAAPVEEPAHEEAPAAEPAHEEAPVEPVAEAAPPAEESVGVIELEGDGDSEAAAADSDGEDDGGSDDDEEEEEDE